jgi:hypothetical protein
MISREGDAFVVTLEEDNEVCVYSWAPGTVVTADRAAAALAVQVELLDGRCWPVLVRMKGMRGMDRDARLVFTQGPSESTSRVAMLAQSPVQRVIANFFLGLSRNLRVPTRMFTDETQARAWLASGDG